MALPHITIPHTTSPTLVSEAPNTSNKQSADTTAYSSQSASLSLQGIMYFDQDHAHWTWVQESGSKGLHSPRSPAIQDFRSYAKEILWCGVG